MADPYAAFSSPDPYAAFSSPSAAAPTRDPVIHRTSAQLRADVADVSPPTRLQAAKTEVRDSVGRLVSDVKTALAPAPAAKTVAPQRNGPLAPLPANPTLVQRVQHVTDTGLHFLAGGDNGTGEVHPDAPGGQNAVAADRVGSDLVDVPMSVIRGGIRAVNPLIDSEAAGGYSAALLAAAPVVRAAVPAAKLGFVNALKPSPVAMETADMVSQFDKAGVTPMLAAKGGGAARMAKVTGENALVGGQVRARLTNAVDEAGASAGRQAERYGAPANPETAGKAVQEGVKGFNDRFSDRATNLYDKAFDEIDRGQQANLTSAQRTAALRTGQGGSSVSPEPVIAPTATKAVLGDIGGSVNAGGLAKIIQDPRLGKVADALQTGSTDVRFGDLRALRTWTREAQAPGNEQLRQGISKGNLQRLEGALTDDINTNAEALAGPKAARRLKQADQFYRLGSQRIQTQLQNFVGKEGNPGESTYKAIIRAAGDKAGADASRLEALKKSLQPHEWGDVAASVADSLGKPTAASGEDFSVNTFATGFRNLSPRGKSLLFGTGDQRAALENLANVMDRLKGIEKMANHSNSGSSAQNVGTLTGLGAAGASALMGHPAPLAAAATGLGALRITGNLMTNPRFVRWLAKKAVTGDRPQARAALTNQLGKIAQEDRRLLPLYQSLVVAPAFSRAGQGAQSTAQN